MNGDWYHINPLCEILFQSRGTEMKAGKAGNKKAPRIEPRRLSTVTFP
jgi:hypothetical protein